MLWKIVGTAVSTRRYDVPFLIKQICLKCLPQIFEYFDGGLFCLLNKRRFKIQRLNKV